MRTRTPKIASVAAVALALAACSGGDDEAATTTSEATTTTTQAPTTTTEATTTTSSTTTTTEATTTTLEEIVRQPLTGEPLEDESEILDRPALAVKIDNHGAARRNHSGLAVADIVFEEIVEGGITRFAAVFHSQDSDPVGPVRSGRSQDIDILTSLVDPLFGWSGGNPGVTRLVDDSTLISLNPTTAGSAFYRGPGSAPHNLYSSTERLWSNTPEDHPGAPPQQFQYVRPGEEFTGDPTTGFQVLMGSIDVDWDWDAEAGAFLRSQGNQAHDDTVHGRIAADNVVIMVADYRPSVVDARSPEAQTVGNGPAYIFSNGQVRQARWDRESSNVPLRFVDEDFEDIGLMPGITWVEIARALPSDDVANPGVDLEIRTD